MGADLRAALVASCLRGALPPVDLRAVCLVLWGGDNLFESNKEEEAEGGGVRRRCGVGKIKFLTCNAIVGVMQRQTASPVNAAFAA